MQSGAAQAGSTSSDEATTPEHVGLLRATPEQLEFSPTPSPQPKKTRSPQPFRFA